jgi:hypothetical protein
VATTARGCDTNGWTHVIGAPSLARDIGQVRDVLGRAGADDAPADLHPTVGVAVAAIPRRG